jgi:hypothetical protein
MSRRKGNGFEEDWRLDMTEDREHVIANHRPMEAIGKNANDVKFAMQKAWQTTHPVISLGALSPFANLGLLLFEKNIIGSILDWN